MLFLVMMESFSPPGSQSPTVQCIHLPMAHQHMEENLSRSLMLRFIKDDQAFLPDKICPPISIGLLVIAIHR